AAGAAGTNRPASERSRHRPVARGRTPPACLASPPTAVRTRLPSCLGSACGLRIPGTRPPPPDDCPQYPPAARSRTTRSLPLSHPALRLALSDFVRRLATVDPPHHHRLQRPHCASEVRVTAR